MVGAIDEDMPRRFIVFDAGVGLNFACCGSGDDEDFDLFPPPALGVSESGCLGLLGFLYELFEVFLGRLDVFRGTGAQHGPHLFFHVQVALSFAVGSSVAKTFSNGTPAFSWKGVAGVQEQHPMCSGWIRCQAASSPHLMGELLFKF